MKFLKEIVKKQLNKKGRLVVSKDAYERLSCFEDFSTEFFRSVSGSRSQVYQDLFVLKETKGKTNGFFVEFGATNGMEFSNTYLLEKQYCWQGILAEPARCWHKELRANRTAAIDYRCVWRESKAKINFKETEIAQLSTIHQYCDKDCHSVSRNAGVSYAVETISLIDLLATHNAPRKIDYISIDTEGSEFEILSAFDFSAYDVKLITCEHNFTSDRNRIFELLTQKGYKRKYMGLAGFDDWYVKV